MHLCFLKLLLVDGTTMQTVFYTMLQSGKMFFREHEATELTVVNVQWFIICGFLFFSTVLISTLTDFLIPVMLQSERNVLDPMKYKPVLNITKMTWHLLTTLLSINNKNFFFLIYVLFAYMLIWRSFQEVAEENLDGALIDNRFIDTSNI